MKVKSTKVAIAIDDGWMTKDFIATRNCGPFGIPSGQEVPIEKIKEFLLSEMANGEILLAITECYGECMDECDVDIELEDGKEYNHNDEFRTVDGQYVSTIEACLTNLVGITHYV